METENKQIMENINNTQTESEQNSRSGSEEQKKSEKSDNKMTNKNSMREIEIEKMVLNCGGTDDKLEKSVKLLKMITGNRKIYQIKSTRRIPAFGISPGKKSGCKVTIRDKEKIMDLLKRFFAALDNKIKKKQITENHASFWIREYIEIPGLGYDRDIGILGFEASLVFKRKGKRVKKRKIKKGKYPKRQNVTGKEIMDFLIKTLDLEVVEKWLQVIGEKHWNNLKENQQLKLNILNIINQKTELLALQDKNAKNVEGLEHI